MSDDPTDSDDLPATAPDYEQSFDHAEDATDPEGDGLKTAEDSDPSDPYSFTLTHE